MIDWHCHLLPGIDDGPATVEDSVALAAALSKAGFTEVYCTPHLIKGSFEADNDAVRKAVAGLQARLTEEGIALKLAAGREYYLDEYCSDYLKDPMLLGDTRYLLIELPNHISPEYAKEFFYRVKSSGYIPMIAHPERCALFTVPEKQKENLSRKLLSLFGISGPRLDAQDPGLEKASLPGYLKDIGCAFQGNLGSFAGLYGERVRQAVMRLHGMGLYTHFGSDMHASIHVQSLAQFMTKDYCSTLGLTS